MAGHVPVSRFKPASLHLVRVYVGIDNAKSIHYVRFIRNTDSALFRFHVGDFVRAIYQESAQLEPNTLPELIP